MQTGMSTLEREGARRQQGREREKRITPPDCRTAPPRAGPPCWSAFGTEAPASSRAAPGFGGTPRWRRAGRQSNTRKSPLRGSSQEGVENKTRPHTASVAHALQGCKEATKRRERGANSWQTGHNTTKGEGARTNLHHCAEGAGGQHTRLHELERGEGGEGSRRRQQHCIQAHTQSTAYSNRSRANATMCACVLRRWCGIPGMGRTTRVSATCVSAAWPALADFPLTTPSSSTTSMPSLRTTHTQKQKRSHTHT